MYILFSPSESKNCALNNQNIENIVTTKLQSHYKEMFQIYTNELKNQNLENLSKLFGLKDLAQVEKLKNQLIQVDDFEKSIYRYSGVAYDYLDFNSLPSSAKEFLKEHLLIFSNLFGLSQGADTLPNYKLSQGEKLAGFDVDKLHKKVLQPYLDELLEGEFVIDLRAKYYEKFYTLKTPHVKLDFLKNGKKVSHWAKAYRGKVARELAIFRPTCKEEFENITFDGLKIEEIRQSKLCSTYIFGIS